MLTNSRLYNHLSDLQLFQLVKQDKREAFTELHARHFSGMLNTAYRRLHSRQQSEDIIQDIFISLYQKRYTLEMTISVKAYLYQALKFKILNIIRDESVRTACRREIFFMSLCKNDSANSVEVRDLDRKINRVLDNLPEKCRQVFLLSRHENLSHRDISGSLNISISTVEKHIVKALKTLRSNLKEYQYII